MGLYCNYNIIFGHINNSELLENSILCHMKTSSELPFIALCIIRTRKSFCDIGIMLGSENSDFQVVVFCTILKTDNSECFVI